MAKNISNLFYWNDLLALSLEIRDYVDMFKYTIYYIQILKVWIATIYRVSNQNLIYE